MLRRALAAVRRSVRRPGPEDYPYNVVRSFELYDSDGFDQADRDALLVALGLLPAPPTGGAR